MSFLLPQKITKKWFDVVFYKNIFYISFMKRFLGICIAIGLVFALHTVITPIGDETVIHANVDEPGMVIALTSICFDTYVAEPTGEVIPEYVDVIVPKPSDAHADEVFHPPVRGNLRSA
jgi:hypothetical protein